MERKVEGTWVSLNDNIKQYCNDEWDINSFFAGTLNQLYTETIIQGTTINYPGDVLRMYYACMHSTDTMYLFFGDYYCAYVPKDTYKWEESVTEALEYMEKCSVRAIFVFKRKGRKASVQEVTVQEMYYIDMEE
jgi:hypothetical protein